MRTSRSARFSARFSACCFSASARAVGQRMEGGEAGDEEWRVLGVGWRDSGQGREGGG